MSGTDTDKTLDEAERIASIVLHLRDVSTSLSESVSKLTLTEPNGVA